MAVMWSVVYRLGQKQSQSATHHPGLRNCVVRAVASVPLCDCPEIGDFAGVSSLCPVDMPEEVMSYVRKLDNRKHKNFVRQMSSTECIELQRLAKVHVHDEGIRKLVGPGAALGPIRWEVPCRPNSQTFYWPSRGCVLGEAATESLRAGFSLGQINVWPIQTVIFGSLVWGNRGGLPPLWATDAELMKQAAPLMELLSEKYFLMVRANSFDIYSELSEYRTCTRGRAALIRNSDSDAEWDQWVSEMEKGVISRHSLSECDLQEVSCYGLVASPALAKWIEEQGFENVQLAPYRVI